MGTAGIEASTLATGSTIETDVCVVGAGPAGLAITERLLARGVDVCVLESGGGRPEAATQALAGAESVGYPYRRMEDTRARAVGGTSTRWSVQRGHRSRPYDAVDFWQRPGVAYSGWPFDLHRLAPYYDVARDLCGLGPDAWTGEAWDETGAAPGFSTQGTAVDVGVLQFGPSGSPFTSLAARLHRSGVRIFRNATVLELVPTAVGDRVGHAVVATSSTSIVNVVAERFVLAAGGIDNARLLLLSRRSHPGGLGNEHDLVGRFFMEHLLIRSGELHPLPGSAALAQIGFFDRHVAGGTPIIGLLRLQDETVYREQLLNCHFFLVARDRVLATRGARSLGFLREAQHAVPRPPVLHHVRNAVRDARSLAAYGYRVMRREAGRSGWADHPSKNTNPQRRREAPPAADQLVFLRTSAEQLPNPESRITLGKRTDAFGQPLARLEWRLTPQDRISIVDSMRILDHELSGAGIATVRPYLEPEGRLTLFTGGNHHMGTTRMHGDPEQGVVDPDSRVHGVDNLYVAGSSVFPTSGAANPTLTLVALAVRLADHLARGHTREEVSPTGQGSPPPA